MRLFGIYTWACWLKNIPLSLLIKKSIRELNDDINDDHLMNKTQFVKVICISPSWNIIMLVNFSNRAGLLDLPCCIDTLCDEDVYHFRLWRMACKIGPGFKYKIVNWLLSSPTFLNLSLVAACCHWNHWLWYCSFNI